MGQAGAAVDPKASKFYEDALQRYNKGDVKGAVIQLKNALQIDKALLPVHVLLGKSLLASSELAAAEAAFDEALRLGVDRAEVVLPLAQAVSGQGRPQDILNQHRFRLEGLPNATRVELLLARAAAASDIGDHKLALEQLAMARASGADGAQTWLAEVPIRIRSGRFDEALNAANKAVALAPQSAQALYALGSVHHAQGQVVPALKAYDRALAIQPQNLEALVGRAGVNLDLGHVDAAKADVVAVRQIYPDEPRAIYLASVIAEQQGDKTGTRAALTQLTNLLDPVPPEFLRYRPQWLMLGGLAHFGLGQTEKAKPYLEGVQRAQGDLVAAKLLAQIYLRDGNIDRAVNTLDAYVRARPADLQAVELLAQAHIAGGRASRGVHVLRNALQGVECTGTSHGAGAGPAAGWTAG